TLPGPARPRRDPWLDAVRGASVVAMVFGHTLDLTLDETVRHTPLVTLYWSFRGLTAPLFLVVAGWALVASLASTGPHTVGPPPRRAGAGPRLRSPLAGRLGGPGDVGGGNALATSPGLRRASLHRLVHRRRSPSHLAASAPVGAHRRAGHPGGVGSLRGHGE